MFPVRILITGGSGLLGQYLNEKFTNFDVISLYNSKKGNTEIHKSIKIDLRNNNHLRNIFIEFKPTHVIHAAALTSPIIPKHLNSSDYFETNVRATESIAKLCNEFSSRLIYISTDLVYAGYRGMFLKEDSKLVPASLYAETKLMGERKVMSYCNNHLILRLSLLYGIGKNGTTNHFQQVVENLSKGLSVNLFTDQFRTPISLDDASSIIKEISLMDDVSGIFNLAGFDRVSRYEFGELICKAGGFNPELLNPIEMKSLNNFPIVEDVSLNIDKLISVGLKPHNLMDEINRILKQ